MREHVLRTHLSDRVARYGTMYSSLLTSLLYNDDKESARSALSLAGKKILSHLIQRAVLITVHLGKEMGVDLKELTAHNLDDTGTIAGLLTSAATAYIFLLTVVLGSLFSIACYIGDAFPSLVYLVYKYVDKAPADFQGTFEEAVLANTNCGGENCHRYRTLPRKSETWH